MAVMMPREKWTDERLDDLNEKVDRGFAEVKAEMREGFTRVDANIRELNARFDGLNARFDGLNARFDGLNARFDASNRNLLVAAVAIIAALIGSNAF